MATRSLARSCRARRTDSPASSFLAGLDDGEGRWHEEEILRRIERSEPPNEEAELESLPLEEVANSSVVEVHAAGAARRERRLDQEPGGLQLDLLSRAHSPSVPLRGGPRGAASPAPQ